MWSLEGLPSSHPFTFSLACHDQCLLVHCPQPCTIHCIPPFCVCPSVCISYVVAYVRCRPSTFNFKILYFARAACLHDITCIAVYGSYLLLSLFCFHFSPAITVLWNRLGQDFCWVLENFPSLNMCFLSHSICQYRLMY